MAKKPETIFKEAIRPQIEALPNTWCRKIQSKTVRGIPDFLLCVRGHFIAIELKKSELDEPDALQDWNIDKIILAGGVGLVAYPANWPDVYALLYKIAHGEITAKPGELQPEKEPH